MDIRTIGLGPGIPPFILRMYKNMTITDLNDKLVRWINSFMTRKTNGESCEVLAIVDSSNFSLKPVRSLLPNPSVDNSSNTLYNFLSRLHANQITTSPFCELPGDTSLGLKPTRKDMALSEDKFIERMPCMDSGTQSSFKLESICFPLIPRTMIQFPYLRVGSGRCSCPAPQILYETHRIQN